ncbi:hypothetical protein COT42_03900 [Candidatus Saganbacteria bacterium CG08_land_8_20_14_0_20_45_16]|uniref:Uncharacterized protein n=1 Tax=Candidatus Saganbacteria bacterium CG08_land_8_20_14_0_20_45_16 TaxID=2014293 RepID=A0A2H0XYE0_UNCSA|nr:MAG: hypothetical protein COT42_03900 [Candidatus Saganbacteria bacterium CG08_land_8_20_14_0_20_45_16]
MGDRILEIGEAGLETSDQKVRKLMDNMVNAEVPGYKKSDAIVRSFPLELAAATDKLSAMKPEVTGSYSNDEQGALIKTDGKLDVALGGEGYFVINGPWGEGYTRDGRFRLDKEGRLLTVAGNLPVLGESGQIVVTPGSMVEIGPTGDIKVDGEIIDRLQVVKPELPQMLESLNGSIFKKKDNQTVLLEVNQPRVIQGFIETSNVNIVDQMMELIYLERIYNIGTKMIQTRDANLARAMELGRPNQ